MVARGFRFYAKENKKNERKYVSKSAKRNAEQIKPSTWSCDFEADVIKTVQKLFASTKYNSVNFTSTKVLNDDW